MTYRELMDEVAALGFDSAVEDTGVLVAATNRALRQLDRALGGDAVHLTLCMTPPLYVCEAPREVAGEWRLPVRGAVALSFESVGQGTLTLTLGERVERYPLSGSSYRRRKYYFPTLRGATVTLHATGSLRVRSLCVLGEVGEIGDAQCLPLLRCGMREYTLTALCPAYIGLRELPRDAAGMPVRDFELRDGVLLLPDRGVDVTLSLSRRRRAAVRDDFESAMGQGRPVDVSPEAEDLLPLAVAAYTLLDVEPQKAAQYRQDLERELLAARSRGALGVQRVYDVRGWR
jgi:hypothetical protein